VTRGILYRKRRGLLYRCRRGVLRKQCCEDTRESHELSCSICSSPHTFKDPYLQITGWPADPGPPEDCSSETGYISPPTEKRVVPYLSGCSWLLDESETPDTSGCGSDALWYLRYAVGISSGPRLSCMVKKLWHFGLIGSKCSLMAYATDINLITNVLTTDQQNALCAGAEVTFTDGDFTIANYDTIYTYRSCDMATNQNQTDDFIVKVQF
jgi:hypothetical protein